MAVGEAAAVLLTVGVYVAGGGPPVGQTTLEWRAQEAQSPLEIRIGQPDGRLMAKVGRRGSAATGEWVQDGMIFFLIEAETGQTLATTTVRVGCPEADQRGGKP